MVGIGVAAQTIAGNPILALIVSERQASANRRKIKLARENSRNPGKIAGNHFKKAFDTAFVRDCDT